jgi:hypothetical protein
MAAGGWGLRWTGSVAGAALQGELADLTTVQLRRKYFNAGQPNGCNFVAKTRRGGLETLAHLAETEGRVDTSIGKCSVNAGPGAVQEER